MSTNTHTRDRKRREKDGWAADGPGSPGSSIYDKASETRGLSVLRGRQAIRRVWVACYGNNQMNCTGQSLGNTLLHNNSRTRLDRTFINCWKGQSIVSHHRGHVQKLSFPTWGGGGGVVAFPHCEKGRSGERGRGTGATNLFFRNSTPSLSDKEVTTETHCAINSP